MDSQILLPYIVSCIGGVISGLLISSYDDFLLKQKHYVLSKKTIIITAVNTAVWMILAGIYGFTVTFLLYALTSTILIALSVIDIAIFEIPIQFNVAILIIGVIGTVWDWKNWLNHVIGMVLVSGIFLILALITKGKGMGGGDIKLMATVGLLLGWKEIFLVMFLGSVLGAIIHSIIMKISKKEHVLAFGPYLSAASVIAMCWGEKIIHFYLESFKITNIG